MLRNFPLRQPQQQQSLRRCDWNFNSCSRYGPREMLLSSLILMELCCIYEMKTQLILFAGEIASHCCDAKDAGLNFSFQWIPPILKSKATIELTLWRCLATLKSLTITIDRYLGAYRLISEHEQRRHRYEYVFRGNTSPPVPPRRITRAAASLLHRLRASSVFTKKTMNHIGRAYRPIYDICGHGAGNRHVL